MNAMFKKIANFKAFAVAGLFMLSGVVTSAHATSNSLKTIATNVQGNLSAVEQLIVALCYVGGIAFAGAAIMKFKQYKDNPQSGTLGQPIALIFIAAALVWLPQIIQTAGTTVFGDTKGAGTASMTNVQVIPGG
jgi:intracellular multiplication protein IcmD